jgi:hypothetical protein
VHKTHSPDTVPAIGQKIAYQANREGVTHRFPDLAVQKNSAVDLARITDDDALLSALELSILKTAKPPAAHTLCLWPTVPGVGKILSRVLLYEIHDLDRSHGGRTASRLVAWARGRKHPPASVWAPRARTSATPPSRGPCLKLPRCCDATTTQGQNS